MRINDLEFRKTTYIGTDTRPDRYEIVKWQGYNQKQTCYTILQFKHTKECVEVKFIGDRPFDVVKDTGNLEDLWELMKYGQGVEQARFDAEEYLRDNQCY